MKWVRIKERGKKRRLFWKLASLRFHRLSWKGQRCSVWCGIRLQSSPVPSCFRSHLHSTRALNAHFGLLIAWQQRAGVPESANVWKRVSEWNLLITLPPYGLCKLVNWQSGGPWEDGDIMADFTSVHFVSHAMQVGGLPIKMSKCRSTAVIQEAICLWVSVIKCALAVVVLLCVVKAL